MELADYSLIGILSALLVIVLVLLIDQIQKYRKDGSFENSIPLYELVEQEKREVINNLKRFYKENQFYRRNGRDGFFRLEEKKFIL